MNDHAAEHGVLACEKLMEVVRGMLGRGAPVVYDNHGFNKLDYSFMGDVEARFRQTGRLSPAQRKAIARGLQKYPRQLRELGVDYDSVAAIAHESELAAKQAGAYVRPAVPETTFREEGDRVIVDFGAYKPEEVAKVRQILGRRYDPNDKTWSFPLESLLEAAALFPGLATLAGKRANRKVLEERETSTTLQAVTDRVGARYPHLYQTFQPQGVAHLLTNRFAILGDDMGLGKTKQAILAANELGLERVLVVCPAGLKGNWGLEIREEDPKAEVLIVNGSEGTFTVRNAKTGELVEFDKAPFRAWATYHWTIINYDILAKYHEELLQVDWDQVILDESHYIKNSSGRTSYLIGGKRKHRITRAEAEELGYRPTRRLESRPDDNDLWEATETIEPLLAKRVRGVWLLSGTAWHNKPQNLFNQLRAARHELGQNYFKFVTRYCGARRNKYGLKLEGATNVEELAAKVADIYLRRTKEDELDLPEKTRQFISCDFDRENYGHLENLFIEGLSIGDLSRLRRELAVSKVGGTIEQVEEILEAGHKVIIFSNFTEPLDRAQAYFGPRAVRVDGGVSGARRQEAMNAFQNDPSVDVFLGQLIAAGTGVTLTAATYVVMNDYDWVPANHHQAEDRAYRIGQRNAVTVYYTHADDTLDEDLQDVFLGKAAIIGRFEEWAAQKVRERRERCVA